MDERTQRDGCGCEARIQAGILDGYACGKPECWRTAVAKASFDSFVADLVAKRERAAQESRKAD